MADCPNCSNPMYCMDGDNTCRHCGDEEYSPREDDH